MTSPLYTLSNVAHSYGARTVLNIPALTVDPGEILAIVGPSGAGKSTLLRLLALLESPSKGTVELAPNGRTVTASTVRVEDRRQMGMVFQQPILLSRSVKANVAYGLRLRGERDSDAAVEGMLQRVDMIRLMHVPARTLSGGEAQRVAIARTLILNPRVLLLDEPTANLDPHNVAIIEGLLREHAARAGTTMVMVTHNIFQAKRLATRVAFLLESELVEVASADRFFTAPQDPRTAAFISGDLVF